MTRRRLGVGLGAMAAACGCGGEVALGDAGLAAPRARPPRPPPRRPAVDPAFGPIDDLSDAERRLYLQPEAYRPLGAPKKNWWRARVPEPGQSYPDFVVSRPNWPSTPQQRLYLLPLGTFPTEFVVEPQYVALVRSPPLAWLADYLTRFFGMPVTLMDPGDLEALHVPTRERNGHQQFDARELLNAVAARIPDDAYSMTALVNRDLFVFQEQEYAFGYGLHRDRQAVMSFAQFDPVFMGEAPLDDAEHVIARRSLAIVSHEVAHTFGLRHCVYYGCVLNGVSHPRELDETPLHLCPVCLRKLAWLGAIDPVARYEALEAFYADAALTEEARWVALRLQHARGAVSLRR